MKALKLTEEHKAKLLEMCNKLFPKEGKWFKVLCENIYYSKNGKFPGRSIHWFEFCHCILLPVIIKESNNRIQFYIDTFTGNPIDYLYSEFLKIK